MAGEAVVLPARNGVRDVAALASVVETCKRNGICLREYLQSVLPGLNDVMAKRAAELTPMAWHSRQVEK